MEDEIKLETKEDLIAVIKGLSEKQAKMQKMLDDNAASKKDDSEKKKDESEGKQDDPEEKKEEVDEIAKLLGGF